MPPVPRRGREIVGIDYPSSGYMPEEANPYNVGGERGSGRSGVPVGTHGTPRILTTDPEDPSNRDALDYFLDIVYGTPTAEQVGEHIAQGLHPNRIVPREETQSNWN